jgi:hypothetical protein
MRVVSGPLGNEYVHFEAPKAERLAPEMKAFLDWFESDAGIDPVLKAGLAHLFSTGSWTASKASSPRRSTRSSPSAPRTRRFGTFCRSSSGEF